MAVAGNFPYLSIFMTLALQIVVIKFVVVVDAGSPPKKLYFDVYNLQAIQWACEPFFELKYIEQLHPVQEETRNICLKLRAGKLEQDNSGNDGVLETDNVTELPTVVVEEEVEVEVEEEEEFLTASTDVTTTTSTPAEMVTSEDFETETSDEIGKDQSKDELEVLPSEEEDKKESLNNVNEGTQSDRSSNSENYRFSVLQKNDGHETDPDGIPTRYMVMQNNRRDLAKAALKKTLEWRKEHDIDTILARPHPTFDISKKVFPHYFCGRDDTNHVILLQRPGLMNVKLAHKNGLTGEGLLHHYVYVMEYLWRLVDSTPDATMTSILDLTEMNMSVLRGEQFRIGSLFLSTMDAHFPQRSHKTLLINAPKWFNVLYKIASPMLRESTKQKIQILSKGKEQDEILQQLLSECPIPSGTTHENVPPGIMEEELRNFCLARLEDAGEEMQSVVPE